MGSLSWYREIGADAAAVAASVAMVMAYYGFIRLKLRANPLYTIHAVNELARIIWVRNVMANPSRDVMAVQTLRNFVMGASLMASTAAILIVGTLTLSGQADAVSRHWHAMSAYGSVSPELWIVKVLALLADFIVAFFAFAMSVRLANHVGFMINVGNADVPPALSPEAVARRLNRAGNHFATGLRAFFFAVPLVFWLFGPAFLVLATLGLVVALHRLDRSTA
jgi:uncharacterized membrane protein